MASSAPKIYFAVRDNISNLCRKANAEADESSSLILSFSRFI